MANLPQDQNQRDRQREDLAISDEMNCWNTTAHGSLLVRIPEPKTFLHLVVSKICLVVLTFRDRAKILLPIFVRDLQMLFLIK